MNLRFMLAKHVGSLLYHTSRSISPAVQEERCSSLYPPLTSKSEALAVQVNLWFTM
ncbi:MAG: hypothetical protein HYW25_05875 [Candidatus Aenigmarchaeota archaeon]|nr:hypothetical protein [Candidatus Aenigmarchaeota archaeon]